MQIVSKIQRKDGHTVDFQDGGKPYEFLPPDYVAEVENPEHIARLLAITEGYFEIPGKAKAVKVEAPAAPVVIEPVTEPVKSVILLGSNVHPAEFSINGAQIQLGTVVQLAFEAAGMNHEAWNGLSDDARADLIDDQLDKLQTAVPPAPAVPPVPPVADEREALVEQYLAKFGKKPHHNAGIEKIKAELEKAAE